MAPSVHACAPHAFPGADAGIKVLLSRLLGCAEPAPSHGARAPACSRISAHTQSGEESGVAWPHTLQINPRRSRCASARTQVSTDGVSISPLHMVSRNCSAGIRSTSTYSSASRGSGWAAGRGSTHRNGVNRLRHLTTRRGVVSAVCEAAGGGGKLGGSGGPPLCLEHTRMVGRQQPHPLAALELRLLRKLALGGVLGAPMLARIVASARQPEDQCRFRQTRLRKLAKKRDAAIGRVKDEHAHKVVAPRVPYDVEIGHPSVGIDDLPVIHCQEAPIYLTLLALHAEARVDIQTTSSGRPGPSSPPALCREQSSYASRCTHSEGSFVVLHRLAVGARRALLGCLSAELHLSIQKKYVNKLTLGNPAQARTPTRPQGAHRPPGGK